MSSLRTTLLAASLVTLSAAPGWAAPPDANTGSASCTRAASSAGTLAAGSNLTSLTVRNNTGHWLALRSGGRKITLQAGATAHISLRAGEELVVDGNTAGLTAGTVLFHPAAETRCATVTVNPVPQAPMPAHGLSSVSLS